MGEGECLMGVLVRAAGMVATYTRGDSSQVFAIHLTASVPTKKGRNQSDFQKEG